MREMSTSSMKRRCGRRLINDEGQEKVKAIVVGAAGKMGGRIIHIINETPSIELCQAVERPDHPAIGWDIGEIIGLGKMGIPLEKSLKKEKGAVIINFSSPQASMESLEFARENGLAAVIGTTGLSPAQMERLRELSKSIRCVFSPNMSVGVNVMFRIVQEVAQMLGPEYDIEILEAHHRLKKGFPQRDSRQIGRTDCQCRRKKLRPGGRLRKKGNGG